MGAFNFAGGGQQVVNSAEDIDSPDKLKARDVEDKAEREKLKVDFFSMEETQDVRQSISGNKQIDEQDKNNLFERLITQLGETKKNGEKFNITNELKIVLSDGTLPLKSGPRAESGESLGNFSKRNQDFKQQLFNSIMEPIEKTTIPDIIKEYNSTEAAPESMKPVVLATTSKTSDIINNPQSIEVTQENNKPKNKETVEKSMQKNLGLESGKELGEKLYNTESRVNNQKQATEIFFSPDKIKQYSNGNPELETLGESILGGEGMDEDLREILGNFVIDSDGTNLSDLDSKSSSEALNNAFDLEVAQLLEGKVNYKEKTVEKLRAEMLNESTNPLEKLLKFKEIESEVNTSIGAIANKTAKLKKKNSGEKEAITKELKLLQKEFHNGDITDERKKQIRTEFNSLKEELNIIKKGEANIGGGEADKINSNIEKIQENA